MVSLFGSFNMFHKRNPLEIALGGIIFRLPFSLMKLFQSVAFRGTKKLKTFNDIARKIASDIVQRELMAARGEAPEGKDIMSNLGKLISE